MELEMELIKTIGELRSNLSTLERYMTSKDADEKRFHGGLIQRGTDFVVYKKDNRHLFAPSRFIGYGNNNMHSHIANKSKHGGKTTPRINAILRSQCEVDRELDRQYQKFCGELGVAARAKGTYGKERKFWQL